MKVIKQGDIFWANLNPVHGHEQAGLRPVLILQNNLFNEHLSTVLIAPLTSNLKTKNFISCYHIPKEILKTKTDSVVLLHQVRCIDKSRLEGKIAALTSGEIAQIKVRLSLLT